MTAVMKPTEREQRLRDIIGPPLSKIGREFIADHPEHDDRHVQEGYLPPEYASRRPEPEDSGAVVTAIGDAPSAPAERYDAAAEMDVQEMFQDLANIDTTDPVLATVGARVDGPGLLYAGAVNGLIGDPEQGKSLVAVALALQALRADPDALVVWLDLDHNGARAFRGRLDSFGAEKRDLLGVHFAQPEDSEGVLAVVEWSVQHAHEVALFVIDSIGELLPMFGASSDSADEYTKVNRQVAARVATAGIAVLTIDHLAKGADSRAFGGTGTVAKKRAVDGALFRVEATTPFAPTTGGTATLRLLKDRHGSVRDLASQTSAGVREPVVTSFVIDATDSSWHFAVPGPTMTKDQINSLRTSADAQLLDTLTPPPTSQRDVQTRMKWGSDRALDALREWRSNRD